MMNPPGFSSSFRLSSHTRHPTFIPEDNRSGATKPEMRQLNLTLEQLPRVRARLHGWFIRSHANIRTVVQLSDG